VCEKYRVLDEHCGPLETANGHCGCESGLGCQWVPELIVASTTSDPIVSLLIELLGKRGMVAHSEPGSYQCAVSR